MDILTRLANIVHAAEVWEEDFDEEVSEDIEEALSTPSTVELRQKIHGPESMDKLDKLLLLLDPKFRDYLEDASYKLPIDGTKKEEK